MKPISAINIINHGIRQKTRSRGYTLIIILVCLTATILNFSFFFNSYQSDKWLQLTIRESDKDETTKHAGEEFKPEQPVVVEDQKAMITIKRDALVSPPKKDIIVTDSDFCPDITFLPRIPQNLTFGRFRDSKLKGEPFLSQDFWVDAVDNRRTYFLRSTEPNFPKMEKLRDWIRTQPHPITLVINNQHDRSWPENLDETDYQLILNEPNLHAVYAGNARKLKNYPKLKPLPIGLKWQFKKTALFGEKKSRMGIYGQYLGTSVEEVDNLFKSENKTSTVWVRPMTNSNRKTSKYIRNTPALKMARTQVKHAMNASAPKSLVRSYGKITQAEYFQEMKKHRFVVSPAGNGLDTHGTWEALLLGSIAIVPKSSLDPLFEDLPVWLVDSWEEVTDEAVKRKEKEFKGRTYNWEKLFTSYWKKEIYKGLCKVADK